MKHLILQRIPSICICFTVITLANTVLAYGKGWSQGNLLILFIWLAVCQGVDALWSRIDFKKWSHYCISESGLLYILSLAFFAGLNGKVTAAWLGRFTGVFLLTAFCVFWYFRRRGKLQAEEINRLLAQKPA